MKTIFCDVINCPEPAVECHAGEIYFCTEHYKGAAAAIRAGLDIKKVLIYKWEHNSNG